MGDCCGAGRPGGVEQERRLAAECFRNLCGPTRGDRRCPDHEPPVCTYMCVCWQAVEAERLVAARWEAAAQAGLAQGSALKDLLEESATWAPPAEQRAAAAGGGDAGAAAAADGSECERLERELLLEKARTAELDLQAREPRPVSRCSGEEGAAAPG